MTEESDNFVNQLESLLKKTEERAKSYYKIEGKDSQTAKELHQQSHNIRAMIGKWKDD